MREGEVVSTQISYDRGWHATANGKRVKIRRDGLGLMVIEPDAAGPSQIDLVYDGGAEATYVRYVGWVSWLIAAIIAISAVLAKLGTARPALRLPSRK
jgi:uncharacterized membrane protein YfhO